LASIINAVNVVVKIGSKVLGCAQSADWTVTRDMDEATCSASSGWKQYSPGQMAWTGSVNGLYREFTAAELATNVALDELFDTLVDGTAVTVSYEKKDGTGSKYSGEAYISEIKYSQPEKGAVTWSATFTGNGAFTRI
jgi:hypothetical protein